MAKRKTPVTAKPRSGSKSRSSKVKQAKPPRLSTVREEDYSYYTVGSLQPDRMSGGDVLATLIRAIAKLATSAVEADPANVHCVLKLLSNYKPRIFRRIALHALALAPGAAPDVADLYLTDTELIEADWCRQEYAELARAWLRGGGLAGDAPPPPP
jgi:hypothetical protein